MKFLTNLTRVLHLEISQNWLMSDFKTDLVLRVSNWIIINYLRNATKLFITLFADDTSQYFSEKLKSLNEFANFELSQISERKQKFW